MRQFKLTYVPTFLNNKDLKRCVFVRKAESATQLIQERHYMPDEKEWMLESVVEIL